MNFVFQFTPLREGRRGSHQRPHQPPEISIHAPPRGATHDEQPPQGDDHISIHAPPRGATENGHEKGKEEKFQFTPLREGRREPGNGS